MMSNLPSEYKYTDVDIIIDGESAKYRYWIDDGAIIISKDVIHRYLYSLFDRVDSKYIIPTIIAKNYVTLFTDQICSICAAKSCIHTDKYALCLRCFQYLRVLSKNIFDKFMLLQTVVIDDIVLHVADIWTDNRFYTIQLDPFRYINDI